MTCLVTVGICVRNGERLLPNAVKSILAQTYPQNKIHWVFIDDGSQDRTPQLIHEYVSVLGSRAKAYKSSWQGLGRARNKIVKEADGDLLLFVDADEILTPSYIQVQVDVMEKNPKVGITAGVFKTVPGNLMLNLEVAPHIVNQKNYGKPTFLLKNDKLFGTGGTTFRTAAVRQVNGFDENIKGAGEDLDLVMRIKRAGWLVVANSAEFYELHGGLCKPRDLWRKYFWYGFGCQRSYNQMRGAFSLPKMTPLVGAAIGTVYSHAAYRFLYQKQMFLLPLQYGFKQTAWLLGFMRAQIQKQKN
jgi:glycosyltransferase involved in cell wall biosynthesis